jgi:hypothetical protein
LRDAYDKFQAAGIKLYAISYDDREVLAAYAEAEEIPFPLLSDIDSEVIRRYGILNTQVKPDDGVVYGIPYPGVFVTDEDGRVLGKFFQNNYKKRDSAELIIDAALGRVVLSDDAPRASAPEDDGIKVSATFHGGAGTLRQGIIRQIVVRFELPEGLHIYGQPVPDGMVATRVEVSGPPGLVAEAPILPPSTALQLKGSAVALQVWSGVVDIRVPIHANGILASEVRPLDQDSAKITVDVRYQACDDITCLLPRSETLTLELPLDVSDVPALPIHMGHGQREGRFDARSHMKRLMQRKGAKYRDL